MGLAFTLLAFSPCQAVSPLNPNRTPLKPALACDSQVATAGYYRLLWHRRHRSDADLAADASDADGREFEIEESADPSFARAKIAYRGHDRASVVSGRGDGTYYYRARLIDGDGAKRASPWSDVVAVTVDHHPLSRALAFFAAGALVFLATLALIVGGSLAARASGASATHGGADDTGPRR